MGLTNLDSLLVEIDSGRIEMAIFKSIKKLTVLQKASV
jgi:hypothetical protein